MQRSTAVLTVACLILLFLLGPGPAWAQNASQQTPRLDNTPTPPKTPQSTAQSQQTPVSIQYTESDNLGRRLVLNLRERISKSRLFRLASGNEQTIQVVISSRDEFEGRPGLSSVYSVVWTFSYGQDVLSNYLEGELGFVRPDEIAETAETLVARTDEIARQYSYLFEE